MRRCLLLVFAAACASSHSGTPAAPTAPAPGPSVNPTAAASTTPPSAPEPDPTPPTLRLPDTARPVRYRPTLTLVPDRDDFDGTIEIDVEAREPLRVLWLNADELTVRKAEALVDGKPVAGHVYPQPKDFVGIGFDPPLPAGPSTVRLEYAGRISRRDTGGIIKTQEAGNWYITSHFEPIDARRAYPCFDEPSYKVPWELAIRVKKEHTAFSNAPMVKREDGPDGMTTVRFAPTKPLPSYLTAFTAGPFERLENALAGRKATPMGLLVPRGMDKEWVWYSVHDSPQILPRLEDYFGSPYPFEKLDMVSVPLGRGAMENPGLVTFASTILLVPRGEETVAFKRAATSVTTHEFAHLWFGDLVTTAWWDDIWLNEAFASWLGDKTLRSYRPEWTRGWSVRYGRSHALELDRLSSARRVRNPVMEKNDLAAAFDSITYQKGAAVLAMFENWFSPEAFRQGVRVFLKRHALGNATSEDFIRALGEASGRGAQALAVFRTFIEQPGVPLVDVALDCGTPPALLVEQQRLLAPASAAPELAWTTPVCVRQGTTTQCADVGNGKSRVQLAEANCAAPLVANAGGRSYYVPRYERSLAERLRAEPDSLSADEMVSSLIDARVLSESGLAPLAEALAWADAGLAHAAPVARLEALELLQKQRDAWLSPAEATAKREIIARRVRPLAAAMTWDQATADTEDERELRPRLMSFAAEVEDEAELRSRARELASAWLAKREAVPATLVPAVLETAARFADAKTYQRLEAATLATTDLRERHDLLSALG
ncbi:MAG: M1 family metallopeptidase, partial [Myxococcales bacterium]